jgi:hypothetical protein
MSAYLIRYIKDEKIYTITILAFTIPFALKEAAEEYNILDNQILCIHKIE